MHAMRRKDRAIPHQQALDILKRGEYGVLSTADADGAPYATPLSYVLLDGALYFHCAQEGQKLRNIARDTRVCFCVVGMAEAVYDGSFGTYYESALVFGHAAHVMGDEKHAALTALCEKYLPAHMQHAQGYIEQGFDATAVVRIDIDHVSGKARARPQDAKNAVEMPRG